MAPLLKLYFSQFGCTRMVIRINFVVFVLVQRLQRPIFWQTRRLLWHVDFFITASCHCLRVLVFRFRPRLPFLCTAWHQRLESRYSLWTRLFFSFPTSFRWIERLFDGRSTVTLGLYGRSRATPMVPMYGRSPETQVEVTGHPYTSSPNPESDVWDLFGV